MKASLLNVTIALAATLMLTSSRASATTLTYHLNITGTGPVGEAGTVVINDAIDADDPANTTDVDVLVTLNPGYDFVKTGAGQALAFNLPGGVSIIDISNGFSAGPTSDSEPPFGTFNYTVTCSGCGNGGSNPLHGPLSFDVQLGGLTADSFIANNLGFYFTADVIGPGVNVDGKRVTGNVAAGGPDNTTQIAAVPEPASLTLLGTGLMFGARRLRRRK